MGGMTDSSMCAQYISLVWNERLIRLERKPDKYRPIELEMNRGLFISELSFIIVLGRLIDELLAPIIIASRLTLVLEDVWN